MAKKKVGIVGGGWAGLAAAIEAVQLGHSVTLFDMAPQLGGRARTVLRNGQTLDNGQHILIGAYTESLRLLRTVGVDLGAAFLRMPLRITYPDAAGLRLGQGLAVPAFVRAVLQQRGWTLTERLALLAAATGWALRGFHCPPRLTVSELTGGLPRRLRQELIDPLCVAALNTASAEASAQVFLRVMKDALFSGAGSADLLLPRVDLSRLFAEPAAVWLQQAGAALRLTYRVERIESSGGRWAIIGKNRADGDSATLFDHVVLACTPVESGRLTRELAAAWSRRAESLVYEPIVTVYLQSAGIRLSEPMLALREDIDSPAQFVFDRGQLGGPAGLLAFVISGAARWVECGAPATQAAVLRQARHALGDELDGNMVTLTEKRATFRCTPGLTRAPLHIAPGLSAAGDHVDGPYPATLEGAVRSGLAAARSVDRPRIGPLSDEFQ